MAGMTAVEEAWLEELLDMSRGYVLGFSNTTFRQFVLLTTERDIYGEQYACWGESKANRLRAFWSQESDELVGKLVLELLRRWRDLYPEDGEDTDAATEALYDQCMQVAYGLLSRGALLSVGPAEPGESDSVHQVIEVIKEHARRNQPEMALDRLHTFLGHYLRRLCDLHSVPYSKDTPLNSVFGSYVKALEAGHLVQTEMTRRILKSSISLLEAFNTVRNDHSLAHPNELLSRHEATLIFNSIVGVFRFLSFLEDTQVGATKRAVSGVDWQHVRLMDGVEPGGMGR